MTQTPDIVRPDPELVRGLAAVESATASGELHRLGILNAHISGPVARTPGVSIAGPALTLQFMPTREDLYQVDEFPDPSGSRTGTCSTTPVPATSSWWTPAATWAAASSGR